MSTLLRPPRRANRTATPPAIVSAVAWHALLKTADKETVRNDLAAGSAHSVNLTVCGDIDGEPFEQAISAILSVAHDSSRASSSTPALDHLIGSILAKLNARTRDAILRELPEQFAAAGCQLPEVPAEIAERTAVMLSRLRAKQSVPVRGSVSCRYRLTDSAVDAKPESRFAIVG
jgi:hypothetical protein